MLIAYTQSLTNADILGQGNLNLVSEKSGKSQGILLSIICGNPGFAGGPMLARILWYLDPLNNQKKNPSKLDLSGKTFWIRA